MKPRFLGTIKLALIVTIVSVVYSHTASAQSCTDLGYSGTHIDIIEREGGANETQYYRDIASGKVIHSSLGILDPTPVGNTSFEYIYNTILYPMSIRRTLSGTVTRQYGSSDFVITPDGTFGGEGGDLYYAFKILFSPKTIGKAVGVAEIAYVTVSSHATSPYEEYSFVQKVCYEFSAIGSQGNGPDLVLSPILIPNSQTDPTSQVPIIPVGVPTQVNVPVSINFAGALPSNILNSSVPVTLQVGSYSSTQNISIASLVANQNQMLVPFFVTLQSNDVGLKTLVASVNATKAVSESNFSNNEAQLNVRVGDEYSIAKEVKIDGVIQESNPIKSAPSRLAGCNSNDIKKIEIKIICLKKQADGIEVAISGCEVESKLVRLAAGPHTHTSDVDGNSTEDDLDNLGKIKARVNGIDSPASEELLSIPITGLNFTYEVSEFAGKYSIDFSPKDPIGNVFAKQSIIVEATIAQNLVPSNNVLEFIVGSHPGNGFYTTPEMRTKISKALELYVLEMNKFNTFLDQLLRDSAGGTLPLHDELQIPKTRSSGASLSWGGAFDIRRNWKADSSLWKVVTAANGKQKKLYNGHCSHRNGRHIDIIMGNFYDSSINEKLRNAYQEKLNQAFIDAKLDFPFIKESISAAKTPDHWHAQPQK